MGTTSLVSSESRSDGVAVLRINNAPVNALSSTVQAKLSAHLRKLIADSSVKAIVIAADASNGFFSSGADVSEFSSISSGNNPFTPEVSWVYRGAESSSKPVVAAIDGVCLGGGLELALCCTSRVATSRSTFGLPELRLGIIPGLGGTQRLPRIVGFERAVQWMLQSTTVNASDALAASLVDDIVPRDSVVDAAAKRALGLVSGQIQRPKPALLRSDKLGSIYECRAAAKRMSITAKKLSKGHLPHFEALVQVSLYGVEHGGNEGLKEEAREFARLVTGPTSLAIVHLFFATRQTAKIPLPRTTVPAKIPKSAGVIGGGLMGAGISTALLSAGIKVVIKEVSEKLVESARARVERNLGRKQSLMQNLSITTEYSKFSDVDIVIEAAPENPRLKQSIFKSLEEICKPDCTLATNTSTLNLDLIGLGCPKAHAEGRLIGAHFFSPAHKMPLLEIVRAESTSPSTIQIVLALAKAMKKTAVVVGNCPGFAVNRMYFPQSMVGSFLVEQLGIDPYRIDAACENFGLPMGPFRLLDLVGLDIGVAIGGVFNAAYADRATGNSPVIQAMLDAGRKGQKSGAGFYTYSKGSRAGKPDRDAVMPFIENARSQLRAAEGYAEMQAFGARLSDKDIVDILFLPCVNEGCRILDEGISMRASDLDVCSAMGMAFPSFRGGLMYWAEQNHGGAVGVKRRLEEFHNLSNGFPLFKPSFALERSASAGAPIGHKVLPTLKCGQPDDIVIVAGFRTAVGRASRGGFKDTLPDNLLVPVIEKILQATGVAPNDIGDVVIGNVLQRGDTGVVQVRVAGVLAGLPVNVPVHTVNRLCSSGLQAIADAAASIVAGHYNVAIAGGMESMSAASMKNEELRPNPKIQSNIHAASCYLSMGKTSENVAEKFGISRERQDRMAVVSHARASAAKLSKRQKGEIVPIRTKITVVDKQSGKLKGSKQVIVDQDEGVRLGVTLEHLQKLPAVFKKGGSTTPGNSSQISDGAAVVMLMKRSEANNRGLEPLATLRGFAVTGVDPAIMGIGPAEVIPVVLDKAGLKLSDIDLFEINEAFGSQADYCIEKLRLNRDIVNVMGGAIAIGHPLGMTGARQTVSIIHELRRRRARYGLVSMCVGTGMGAAAIYEITRESEMARL